MKSHLKSEQKRYISSINMYLYTETLETSLVNNLSLMINCINAINITSLPVCETTEKRREKNNCNITSVQLNFDTGITH